MTAAAVTGPDRAAWLAARKQGIGGSDAAAVVGLHPWVSPLALFYDKRGELGLAEEEPTEAMEWGIRLEPVVAEAWAEKTGRRVRRFKPYDPSALRWHPTIPWMFANLDGAVVDDRDVEVEGYEGKTASGWAAEDWADGVPPHVVVQCQHQMAVTGYPRTQGAVLLGGQRFVAWVVERDDEIIDGLIAAERTFWERVEDGRPPPADSHPATSQVLKARWQETLDEAVELGDEGRRWVLQRHEAKAEADAAAGRQAEAENRLRQLLGDREVGTVFDEIAVTWRQDKNGTRRLSVKELA